MAQKETIKNLTLAELKKQDKALDDTFEFQVDINGQKYKLTCDKIFRNSKKAKVLNDMVSFFGECARQPKLLDISTPFVTLMVFKHFTTLEVSDELTEAMDLLQVLLDLDVFDKILSELPEKETEDVFKLLTNSLNTMRENLEGAEAEAQRLSEIVDNEEVKALIPNVNK